jgi:hypothetical protein
MAMLENDWHLEEEHGQWLAVISGRFLPVIEISISIERHRDTVSTNSGITVSPIQRVGETITVDFKTARRPDILPRVNAEDELHTVFVNEKYELLIHDPRVGSSITNDERVVWSIKLEGLDYDISER